MWGWGSCSPILTLGNLVNVSSTIESILHGTQRHTFLQHYLDQLTKTFKPDNFRQDNGNADWDYFRETVEEGESDDEEFWAIVFKFTKIVFAFLLSLCVLGSALLSKVTLLALVSNINPPSLTGNLTHNATALKTANHILVYPTSGKLISEGVSIKVNIRRCFFAEYAKTEIEIGQRRNIPAVEKDKSEVKSH